MKLSCLPVSFFQDIQQGRLSVAEWAAMGASLGLDAIDLSIAFVPDRAPQAVQQMRRAIEATGMRVAMLTSYTDFTHPDPARRRFALSDAQEVVGVAAGLGAQLLRVTAGQAHPETPRGAGIAWAVEGLTQLLETSRDSGVTLVYENHAKPFVWEYTDFSQPPDIFLEIAQRTSDAGLGINFDTANATAFSDDPGALLDRVVDRVVSVHANDTAEIGALRMVLLGRGLVPFEALFRRLKRANFDGWICMEEGANQGKAGVKSAAEYIRRTWAEA